jgi:UDP-N-acetylmuramate: L-alanyl-gamma-D-glutamyl-meso-diaminopimelate ligase
MASLAGLLDARGYRVTGSDGALYPPTSELLSALGVPVTTPYAPSNVPQDCSLVVVGNAISRGNPELESVLNQGIPCASMPEVVREVFLRGRTPIVIAGTHGKTTTTTLVAWILDGAGLGPGFLIGGAPVDFERSFRVGDGDPFVIEGDEYDSAYFDKGPKFLHYLPRVGVLGNVEFDHADIYRDVEDVERAFALFVNLLPQNGLLVYGADSERARKLAAQAPCRSVGYSVEGTAEVREMAQWRAAILDSGPSSTTIRVQFEGSIFGEFEGAFWGRSAVRNVLAAIVVADHLGCTPSSIASSLRSFHGVRRRMELLGEDGGISVVDDFAHHPTAIRETLSAARARWPSRKIWGVFEPRSFTARSSVFQSELGESLSHADEVIVGEVLRSARLPEDHELSEEELVESLEGAGTPAHFVPDPDEIAALLVSRAREGDVVLVMSNGSFGGLHRKLLSSLSRSRRSTS